MEKQINMKLYLLLGFLSLTQTLFAQSFTQAPTAPPFDEVVGASIAFSDVNADGHEDVLITGKNSSGRVIAKLYTNDGTGKFTIMRWTPFEGVSGGSIAFSDVNGDGHEDVLITGQGRLAKRIAKLYTNDGTGKFTERTGTPFEGVSGGSIAFSDVNGDGHEDVLITGYSSISSIAKLYTNDGTGKFTEMTATPFENVSRSSVAFSDVNGDGYEDLLITGQGRLAKRIAKLYTNDGTGNFTEITGTPFDGVKDGSIAFADVNGDGHKDVLITGNSSGSTITKLYTNDGTGNFTERTGTPFEGVSEGSIAFSDVNGNGHEDVIITGQNRSGSQIAKLYTNDGTGSFTERTGTPFEGVEDGSVAFSDVNGDGHEDILITGSQTAKLYTNDGTGNFTEITGTPFDGVKDGSIAFADVNGDGHKDVFITGIVLDIYGNERIAKLYTNDGTSSFTEMRGTRLDGVRYGSIAFSDVNGDGYEDVLITGQNIATWHIAKLYTNDGMGNFTERTGTPFEGVEGSSIAFSDVNGDGYEDVLITGVNKFGLQIAKLYTNDGTGNFTEITDTPFKGVGFGSVAFSDVNGDGYEDVLITGVDSSGLQTAKLYTNDGMGNFTEMTGAPFQGVSEGSIAFSDVNGDGHEDVLITGRQGFILPIAKLYTNDGMGNFTEMTDTPFNGVWLSSIAFSDVNGDGHEDVLITGFSNSGPIAKLYTNDGMGIFTEITGTPFEGVGESSIAFADINGNGREDVLITGNNSSDSRIAKLYINEGTVSSTDDLIIGVNLDFTPYPNPTRSNILNVSFNSAENGFANLLIYDLNGRLMSQQKESIIRGQQILSVNITSLSPGSYFIQMENGIRTGVAKFVVQ